MRKCPFRSVVVTFRLLRASFPACAQVRHAVAIGVDDEHPTVLEARRLVAAIAKLVASGALLQATGDGDGAVDHYERQARERRDRLNAEAEALRLKSLSQVGGFVGWLVCVVSAGGGGVGGHRRFQFTLDTAGRVLANDERTRGFLGVPVTIGKLQIVELIDTIDGVLRDFSQPPYYAEKLAHVSIAWTTDPQFIARAGETVVVAKSASSLFDGGHTRGHGGADTRRRNVLNNKRPAAAQQQASMDADSRGDEGSGSSSHDDDSSDSEDEGAASTSLGACAPLPLLDAMQVCCKIGKRVFVVDLLS